MKPVLTVEGKRQNVVGLGYTGEKVSTVHVLEDSGVLKTYQDTKIVKHYIEGNLLVDMDKALVWVNQYKEIHDDLDRLINQKVALLNILAHEGMQSVYPDQKQQEYREVERELLALRNAQGIVESYMVEDVDLSGGEEV